MPDQMRAVLLDLGRKRFSPDWLEAFVDRMCDLGLNTLHLHLSDTLGLGVELPGYEHLSWRDALTSDDIARLRRRAQDRGVQIIPGLDTPSHATALLAGRRDWMLRDRTGELLDDHLDLTNRQARNHVHSLWQATLQLFDPEYVHLGGDEYFAAPWQDAQAQRPDRFPSLIEWARAHAGPEATAHDAFALYVREIAERLQASGCRTLLWNDHVVPDSTAPLVPIPTDVILDVWIRWRRWTPSIRDYLESGYRVLNSNADLLYFVLAHDGPPAATGIKSGEDIAATFRPGRFMGLAGERTWSDVDSPQQIGAKLSIWCDNPNLMDEDELWRRVQSWLEPFAESFRR